MSTKRAAGGGRSKLGGTALSRLRFSCQASPCNDSFRSDNLKIHYLNTVKFDSKGVPLHPNSDAFKQLKDKHKVHTLFFHDNGYSLSKLPPLGRPIIVEASVFNYFSRNEGESSTKKSRNDESEKEIEDSDNVLSLIDNTTEDGNVIEEDHISVADIVNNASGDVLEEDNVEHDVVVEAHNSTDELQNIDLDYNSNQRDVGKAATMDDDNRLAELISDKLARRLGIEENETIKSIISESLGTDEGAESLMDDNWIECEDYFRCEICLHVDVLDVPRHILKDKKGNFGTVNKNQKKYHIKETMILHQNNPVHTWCAKRLKQLAADKAKAEEVNLKAATLVATNAAFCLKTFGSAKDFVRENDKDNLTEGLIPAFKNDGSQEFFSYRDIYFLKLSDAIKNHFKENVDSFSVTLDKVTHQRISYTVIITYFFSGGRIYSLLNSVHKMNSNDYNSNETAQMVARVLIETLGLSLEGLKQRMHHFTYDGVYCSPEERLHGGGGLSLCDKFGELLGLQPGEISGNHDMSHNLQLAYSDVFNHDRKGDKKMKKIINDVYSVMSDYNSGQAGSIFMEAAMKLNHVVLANKGRNKTRFVRSDFRGLQTYMTNIPTLYSIQGEVFKECNDSLNITRAKVAEKFMANLSDGNTLASLVGYSQFLEIYVECSLTSQHAQKFPTSIIQAVLKLEGQLESLASSWVWFDSNLKFGRFGAPSVIISDLLSGTYKPYIDRPTATRNIIGPNIYRNECLRQQENIIAAGVCQEDLEELLNWDPPIAHVGPSGDSEGIPVTGFSRIDLMNVENHMKDLASDLHGQLSQRVRMWPLLLSALEGLGGDLSWVDDECNFNENTLQKLTNIISDLTGPAKDQFDVVSCLPAYKVFVKFARDQFIVNGNELEVTWKLFWAKYNSNEMYVTFIQLFEHIQVKSYSEALCETVGSLMKIHHGRCRNVHPVNFNKELFLRFNLPPLHVMKKRLIPDVVQVKLQEEKKMFVSKTARKGMLKFGNLSSSVGNFRVKEEEASHLPLSLFD